jgi:hypothetical protein
VAATAQPPVSGHRGGPRVPIAPFREWLTDEMQRRGTTVPELAGWFGVDHVVVEQWLYRRHRIELYTADHYLCRIGRPDLVSLFWPVDD